MKVVMLVLLMVLLFGVLPVQAQSACPEPTALNFVMTDYGNGFTAVQSGQPDGYLPIQRKLVYTMPIMTSHPFASVEFDFRVTWASIGAEPLMVAAIPGVDVGVHGFAGQFSWEGHPHRIEVQDNTQRGVWYHNSYPWIRPALNDLNGYANPPDMPVLCLSVVLNGYNQNTTATGLQIDVRNITVIYSS
jgi:hypothetical protein